MTLAPHPARSRPWRWTWGAILLSVLVCLSISLIHLRQRAVLGAAVEALEDVRRARVDLAKGFLHASLAEDPAAPFDRPQGLALLDEALASLESLESRAGAAARLGSGDPDWERSAAGLRASVARFREAVAAWRAGGVRAPDRETRIRVAYFDLERRANALDAQVGVRVARLIARLDALFVLTVSVAAVLLAGVCATIFAAERTRRRAAVERERLAAELAHAQKMDSIGRLAGGVAHDFNNLLSVILSAADALKERLRPGDPAREEVAEIEQAAFRSRDMTRQLLAFSRRQPISPRALDLDVAVATSLKTLTRLIGEDVRLAFQPGAGGWRVRLDPVQLDQILVNLAVNARDAMPGGGRLTIETSAVEPDGAPRPQGAGEAPRRPSVILRVRDEGAGMDEETLAHVFEPFFTTKAIGAGTGLGLATVYGIVTQNGGSISVKSARGVGTTVELALPRWDQPDAVVEKPLPHQHVGSGTVLVVEDDHQVRRATSRMLEHLGYRVVQAEHGLEALELFRDAPSEIDLVVSDVVMPGLNGPGLRAALEKLRPDVRVILVSGYAHDHQGELAVEGAILQKPFTLDELADRIRAVTARR